MKRKHWRHEKKKRLTVNGEKLKLKKDNNNKQARKKSELNRKKKVLEIGWCLEC